MKLLSCICIGIIAALMLVHSIGTAEDTVFSNETVDCGEVEVYNLSFATNTSNASISLTGEPIMMIPEDETFSHGNGEGTSTLIGIDETDIELQVAETTRVSVRTNGKQGDSESYVPSISPDGRYVTFESLATNLVNGDKNGAYDIFVHDYKTGKTARVSVRTNGKQGNGHSYDPSISSAGRYVAFESTATNLVNGDTNGVEDIFVHDQQTGETRRVSVRTNGAEGNGNSYYPSISSAGRYVAFESEATNLVNGDTNGAFDIFIHDRETGKTERVSVRTNGVQGDAGSYLPSISSDGRYVAFESDATNLVNKDTNGVFDIFIHDRETGKTERVSVKTNGVEGDAGSNNPSISSAGRYVAFESYAANLVNGDTNGASDIFIHDRQTGETRRVSVRTNGAQGDGNSYYPSISSDGRYVAFYSYATNLANGDTNGASDVFVHDRQTGETRRVSVRTNGKQGDYYSYYPSISSDGRYVAFDSLATNLVNKDTNGARDIFVAELST